MVPTIMIFISSSIFLTSGVLSEPNDGARLICRVRADVMSSRLLACFCISISLNRNGQEQLPLPFQSPS
jgi:hypothetical protein